MKLRIIKAPPRPGSQDRLMTPPENPPKDQRTSADRLTDVSPLVWWILGLVTVVGFIALGFALSSSLNG